MNLDAIPICKIRDVISSLLPAGHPTLALVAGQLGMSPRSLQRQLAEISLTHSQLVSQARITKACQ